MPGKTEAMEIIELVLYLIWGILEILAVSNQAVAAEPEPPQLRQDTRSEGEILSSNRRRAGWTPRRGESSGGFVIVKSESVAAEARCPICAQEAKGEVRGCPSCGVVLHRDCMQYNGSCGIYGCGSAS